MSLYTETELRNLPAGTKIYTQGRELTVHKVGTKYLHVKNEYDRNDQLYLTAKVFKTAEAMNASPEPTSHNSAEELFKDLDS